MKLKGSLAGAILCGITTVFFVLMANSPMGAGDALVPMFAMLLALISGIGFLVFILIWAVHKLKS